MRKKYITLTEEKRKYIDLPLDAKSCIMIPSYKNDGTALVIEKVCNEEGKILAYFRYIANASGKAISEVTNSLYPRFPNTAEYFNRLGSVGYKKVLLEHLKKHFENKKEENVEMVR